MKLRQQTIDFPKLNGTLTDKDRATLIRRLSVNVQVIFAHATDAEIIDGIAWYSNARGYAYTLARRFNVSLDTASAVIAALSPNCGWTRNKLDALTVFLAHADGKRPSDVKVTTYNNNKNKAFYILDADDYARGTGAADNPFAHLGGLKTRAFADNIGRAESCEVTIDFHAASVARGIRQTTQNAKALSANQYAVLVEAYRYAARELGLRPYELQAIVWCVWRRLHGVHAIHG